MLASYHSIWISCISGGILSRYSATISAISFSVGGETGIGVVV